METLHPEQPHGDADVSRRPTLTFHLPTGAGGVSWKMPGSGNPMKVGGVTTLGRVQS